MHIHIVIHVALNTLQLLPSSKNVTSGGQERNLLVVPIVSKTMSEANFFTPSMDNDHRSACCQKHGSFSEPAASIVSFNCEGLSEAR